jgi:hypothetical protein
LPPDALGDQPVGHLIGPAIKLAIGEALSLEMDGHPIGTGSGVLARDVADPGNVGNAGDIVHAFLLESAADLRVAGACGASWLWHDGRYFPN